MFFFGKETPEQRAEKERKQAEKVRQERSIGLLERGELPLSAQERIAKHNKKGGQFFSSDLSCAEHLLTSQAGYRPISQVMGSAFVNISLGGIMFNTGRSTGEMTAHTEALLMARRLAVSRMEQEAKLLGAHGVISVELKVKNYNWDSRLIEVTAIGTAIDVPGRPAGEAPFSSDLSGQDFWQLHSEGYWPVALVLGICAYYAHTDLNTQNQITNRLFGPNANLEVALYTESFYRARSRAMFGMELQAVENGAEGVVGMKISHTLQDIEYEINNTTRHDMIITLEAVGTAIKRDPLAGKIEPIPRMVIMDLRRGTRHRQAELATERYTQTEIDDYDDDNSDDE